MDKKFEKAVTSLVTTMAILFSFLPTTVFAGDSFSAADTIALNVPCSGALETDDDVNYYKFTTSNNDSFYKVELRNSEVTDAINLILYSEDDATTDIFDLRASVATANSDTRKLEPNHTYYISVQKDYFKCTGNYKLSVTEIKDDVPDNYSNSTSISLNKKKAYNLEALGDSDCLKFTTTSNDSYYKIELANTEATDTIGATLYYEDDVTTDVLDISAYKASIGSKTVKLEPKHTYYVVIQAPIYDSPVGGYKLCVTEIKDDSSDTFKNCTKISLNKKSTYKLNVDGDVDYFKFKASKSGTYTITLANKSGNDGINAIIYSEADVTQSIGTITSYKAAKNTTQIKVKKNHTYYIGVAKSSSYSSVTGEYSLTIKN
ncbi:hypothetical protein SAMN02745136_00926 [Anaerocolumna jejuensis DSM 15929]|uniref:Pre-peptidase C-terminal domain-containing protein n=1 Tax=Anaerocolumna jejuensis DSM 15929 TaxID=1121322 RepID=A0A1M6MAT7_9FIRM|nr:hypothetical protein [Anaerocolumna jejuensis]SHJ80534.1 hypothetical protein SAMN02745136_00926 [Anaerocolumna jejuensis DSM 15929]